MSLGFVVSARQKAPSAIRYIKTQPNLYWLFAFEGVGVLGGVRRVVAG